MIPHVIHYCWFGRNPLPELAIKCIESWKKYLPDYEIKEWNEDNFDVNMIPYAKEAYEAKKYAFVSDYARFYILYHYGGLYFDTDVEIIKSLDDVIAKGSFMGCENEVITNKYKSDMTVDIAVAPGLGLGCEPALELYAEIIDTYKQLHFVTEDGKYNLKTVVHYVTEILCSHGLMNTNDIQFCTGIYIYPSDWFCPISVKDGKLRITGNTRTIHHYAQSWQSPIRKYGRKLILCMGGAKLKNVIKKILFIK